MSFSSAPRSSTASACDRRRPSAGFNPHTQIARVVRMVVVDEILPPEGDGERCAEALRKLARARAVPRPPQTEPPSRIIGRSADVRMSMVSAIALSSTPLRGAAAIVAPGAAVSADRTSSGRARTTGPGRPLDARRNARSIYSAQPVGAFDLGHPFDERPEERAVVHLLEHPAVAMGQRNLSHENHPWASRHASPRAGPNWHWWRRVRA